MFLMSSTNLSSHTGRHNKQFFYSTAGNAKIYIYTPQIEKGAKTSNSGVERNVIRYTETHFSKEIAEISFENADVKSICYCKEWIESKLSHSSECVEVKLCKPCTSFASHRHSSCEMVWYRTVRVNVPATG